MGRDKREKEKRFSKAPGYVAVPWDLLNSMAYKNLKPSSAKALIYFRGKPQLFFTDRQYMEADFAFTYPEARNLGFGRSTFYDAICNLVEFGFIDPVSKGGLRGLGKTTARFRVSDRWKQYGQDDFGLIDFKRWGT